ncbi:MAG: hypothetical protein JRI54_09760, partial [Deltaproteobacteria bacterium]|nr:hypothetical protein [Deltaproteobacteria bacterium]
MIKKVLKPSYLSILIIIFCMGIFISPSKTWAVKKGGVLKIGFGMTAVKLDPHASSGSGDVYIMAHIYERLLTFKLDEKTKKPVVMPSLAAKWEVTPNKMAWIFYLRKDVKFTDGTPFNAEAVKFNIDRLLGPPPLANARNYGFLIKNTEVIDEYTVKVNLKIPAVPVESYFVQSYIGMISPAAVKKWGDKIGTHPVGTGPYKLKQWVHGEKAVLEANTKHWKGRPNLDQVEFRFIPESASRLNMLKTGQIDLAFNLDVPDLV